MRLRDGILEVLCVSENHLHVADDVVYLRSNHRLGILFFMFDHFVRVIMELLS